MIAGGGIIPVNSDQISCTMLWIPGAKTASQKLLNSKTLNLRYLGRISSNAVTENIVLEMLCSKK